MKGIVLTLLAMLVSSCMLHTKPVHLQLPQPAATAGELKPAVIESITDARTYDIAELGGPRLKQHVDKYLTDSMRPSAIGGLSAGPFEYSLRDQGSVVKVMRDLLTVSLAEKGYRVVDSANADAATPRISVRIDQFWADVLRSFGRELTWTQQMKAWINTGVEVKTPGNSRQFEVQGYGASIIQLISEGNIQEVYLKAMEAYQHDLGAKLFSSM